HFWLSQRAQILCDLSMDRETAASDPEKLFALWLRYQNTNDRAFHKSLDQILKLRAQRFKEAIGFERQKEQMIRERERAERTRHIAEHERQRLERHKLAISLAEAKLDHQKLLNAAFDLANFRIRGEQNRPLCKRNRARRHNTAIALRHE
ncbi:MAG: hypothetical protein ACRD4O_00110, partial [Bryobacteraceae bacterium]